MGAPRVGFRGRIGVWTIEELHTNPWGAGWFWARLHEGWRLMWFPVDRALLGSVKGSAHAAQDCIFFRFPAFGFLLRLRGERAAEVQGRSKLVLQALWELWNSFAAQNQGSSAEERRQGGDLGCWSVGVKSQAGGLFFLCVVLVGAYKHKAKCLGI